VDRIRAVLFDFGGVFTPSPFAVLDTLGEQLGADPQQLMRLVFGPYEADTDHPWHRLERGEVSFLEAREAILALGRAEGVDADPIKLFSQVGGGADARKAMVARTKALRACGFGTALVTNNVREFRERWVTLVPVDELFQHLLDSSELGIRKPDPRIFQLALERLGVGPEEALFLDDFPANLEAAERLGIRTVLVEPDGASALAILDDLLDAGPAADRGEAGSAQLP